MSLALLLGLALLVMGGLAARVNLHWKLLRENEKAQVCMHACVILSMLGFVLIWISYPQMDIRFYDPTPGF